MRCIQGDYGKGRGLQVIQEEGGWALPVPSRRAVQTWSNLAIMSRLFPARSRVRLASGTLAHCSSLRFIADPAMSGRKFGGFAVRGCLKSVSLVDKTLGYLGAQPGAWPYRVTWMMRNYKATRWQFDGAVGRRSSPGIDDSSMGCAARLGVPGTLGILDRIVSSGELAFGAG